MSGTRSGSVRPFEVLNGTLVLLRGLTSVERAQVPALAGSGVGIAGIKAVFAGLQLPDHTGKGAGLMP